MSALSPELAEALAHDLGLDTAGEVRTEAVGGGCIHQATRVEAVGREVFLKRNSLQWEHGFACEAAGLEAIAATGTIRVPRVLGRGCAGGEAYLALEYLDLGGRAGEEGWRQMGRNLAALHRCTGERHGWETDSILGSTPQPGGFADDWATFFRDKRLRFQFELAQENGMSFPRAEEFLAEVPALLAGHEPEPSLLHGDLWGGNASFTRDGEPVVFDPACYYGDRETDLAFTRMFGGFAPAFYEGYEAVWPRPAGHEERARLYNLYHILNHANLFGGGYAREAEAVMDALLRG